MPTTLGTATTNTRAQSRTPVTATTLFTKSIDTSGWLLVRLEPSGERVTLCEYTKVLVLKEAQARVFFTVLEGRYRGKEASLSAENKSKCLISAPRGSGAKLSVETIGRRKVGLGVRPDIRNQLIATLSFNGQTASITLDSDVVYTETNRMSPYFGEIRQSEPLPAGTYKILTPESAKDRTFTDFYADPRYPGAFPGLKYHAVWFPIEYAATHNSNFIHVGNLSEGCVTIYELKKWNDLYAYLISNRSDKDGKYIGTVTIK